MNYKNILLTVVLFCSAICNSFSQTTAQKQKRDSLLFELNKYEQTKKELKGSYHDQRDTIKADLLWQLYMNMNFLGDSIEEAQKYIEQIKEISTALNYKKGIGNALTGEGVFLLIQHKYMEAAEVNRKALEIRKEINDELGIRWSYWNIGADYQRQNLYKDALPNYLASLRLCEKDKDSSLEASCLMCIGGIFNGMSDYKSAIEYTGRSINLYEALHDSLDLGYTLQYQADNLNEDNQFDEAHRILRRVFQLAQNLKNRSLQDYYYAAAASLFMKQKKYDEAIKSYRESAKLELELGIDDELPYCYAYMGECIMEASPEQLAAAGIYEKDRFTSAKVSMQKSLDISLKDNIKGLISETYALISKVYEKENNTGEAFRYFKLYVSAKDTFMNGESFKTINNLKQQYESEKKEQQIVLLDKDKSLQQTEIEKQKTTRNSFIGGFALILLIGGVTFNRYQVKQKANRELSVSLERLKNTQQQLVEQEKFASLGALTAGIAHEIKNPLNFINNFSELNTELVEDLPQAKSDEERNKMLGFLKMNFEKISEHGNRADSIVRNMLAHRNNEKGEKELTDVNELCDEYFRIAYKAMRVTNPEFKCEIKSTLDAKVPKINLMAQDFSRVLLNILGNAFYAVNERKEKLQDSNYKPHVSLITKFANNAIAISVKDNGTGIPEKVKEKIFEPFYTTKPAGQGTGLGLSLSFDIIKAHNGTVKVESKENEFTEFIISLPT